MGTYIHVNHSKFEGAAQAIENYISKLNRNMAAAGSEVTTLSTTWKGGDSTQFQIQWNRVTEVDSTSKQMTKALENYAKFLRFAASEYKDAQSKAVNRANFPF